MIPKRPRDPNQLAKHIIDLATGQIDDHPGPDVDHDDYHRRGGLKGGDGWAKKLSAEERSEIAKKGAAARWKKDLVRYSPDSARIP